MYDLLYVAVGFDDSVGCCDNNRRLSWKTLRFGPLRGELNFDDVVAVDSMLVCKCCSKAPFGRLVLLSTGGTASTSWRRKL